MKLMEETADHVSVSSQSNCSSIVSRGVEAKTLVGLVLSTALLLCSAISSATAQQVSELEETRIAAFLQAYKPSQVLRPDDPAAPQFCLTQKDELQCPDIVTTYGAFPSPGIDDITTGYKNVRVSMYINSISNTAVSGGGVANDDALLVTWETSSVDADEQNGGPFLWVVPSPGETVNPLGKHSEYFGWTVYDALVFGACGSLSSFELEHTAVIEENSLAIGAFGAVDDSTVNSTGYYGVDYTVTAKNNKGAVSDIRFKGKLHVLCSGLETLP